MLANEGIGEQVIFDFLKLRKAKKAPLTETAIDGIKREAVKAGITLEDALRTCIERGWQGFKADWYANQPATGKRVPESNDEYEQRKRRLAEGAAEILGFSTTKTVDGEVYDA